MNAKPVVVLTGASRGVGAATARWLGKWRKNKMAKDPGIGYHVSATVISTKGTCSAGHTLGKKFEISCHNPGGLCGFFYHSIFPSLSTFQFGGSYPWWEGDTIELGCPDSDNLVIIKLERSKR